MNLLNGAARVCPYCYASFAEREIRFRCTGRPSRGGDKCSAVEDEARRQHLGRRERLPPVFAADGRRAQAQCPGCQGSSAIQVCPVCHTQLPVNFGKTRSRLIALVGARESGKTVFMTVLIHELMNRVGARFSAAVGGSDDFTRHRFVADYETPLYDDSQLLGATRRTGITREPLVFRFTTQRRTIRGNRPEHTLLSFFDTAGEDLNSEDSVETNLRYLNSADGIIVVLDPLQMEGARTLADPATRLPDPGRAQDRPIHMLERVTDLLMRKQAKANHLLNTPIGVCFTKIDALWHEIAHGTPLRRPEQRAPYFDQQDSEDSHAQIQQLLHRWDGGSIDNHVSNNYKHYRYFGVSALGEPPTTDNKVSGDAVRPYRVADPFLWMLSTFDVIPGRKGG